MSREFCERIVVAGTGSQSVLHEPVFAFTCLEPQPPHLKTQLPLFVQVGPALSSWIWRKAGFSGRTNRTCPSATQLLKRPHALRARIWCRDSVSSAQRL